ncbi:Sec-independent protein translocase subunit TatB [Rhodococcus sp. HNM0563]|uniref:Sec-independent protein translocase protein TatB n=1 Tax=unclassified Rhodococcus (in: high G+C Gram-positive bacteria) TaxID=192944 RepID=UPI00146C882C|nr:Sec-independent protein translocase protein TatB [Rhodococcus sp. F64268]MCK0089885.1 Sec-independent protein translocase protein TatB [Rhodococcus sp. F64268]NLU62166.1 Sec-independent protein translocase subunit TatB [Rhodococcus sp. HNM0563]
MFGNIGWGEFMVLLIAALVVLGPERLPGAVSWVTKSLRQVREYASGARQQLKDELGPEFDDLQKPLSDLNQLRGMTPKAVITKHLLDGDDSILTGKFDSPATNGSGGGAHSSTPSRPDMAKPLAPGEIPPIDPDAT